LKRGAAIAGVARHAFQKKSKKGIATPKPDVDLIKQRFKEARELAEHEQVEQ
jgi:phage-related protein